MSALLRRAARTTAIPTSERRQPAAHPTKTPPARRTARPERPTRVREKVKKRPLATRARPTSLGLPVSREMAHPNRHHRAEPPTSVPRRPVLLSAPAEPTWRRPRPSGWAELPAGPAALTSSCGGAGFSNKRRP